MNILVLNGPNLNMLGLREEDIYGSDSLKDIENRLAIIAERNNCKIDFYQSNAEHELIDVIQNWKPGVEGSFTDLTTLTVSQPNQTTFSIYRSWIFAIIMIPALNFAVFTYTMLNLHRPVNRPM